MMRKPIALIAAAVLICGASGCVEAELHVWDGMWHGFYLDVDLPESKDAYQVMGQFFDRHLAAKASTL